MTAPNRTLELDPETDDRLRALAAARGQDPARVVSDALDLLATWDEYEEPDVEEDLRRLEQFERTGVGIPSDEVKAWVESWGGGNELPRPHPRKLR